MITSTQAIADAVEITDCITLVTSPNEPTLINFAMDLAESTATGGKFCGYQFENTKRVLYISDESIRKQKTRFKSIDAFDLYTLSTEHTLAFYNEETKRRIEYIIDSFEIDILVLDTTIVSDIYRESEVVEAFRFLEELAKDGVRSIIMHPARKVVDSLGIISLEGLKGTSYFKALPRIILYLSPVADSQPEVTILKYR